MLPDPATRRDEPEIPPHDDDRPPPELPDLQTFLLSYARKAAAFADRLTPSDTTSRVPGHAPDALAYIRAAREALQARQLAEEPVPTGERVAIAGQVAALRRKACEVEQRRAELEGQRDALAALLNAVIATLDADEDEHGRRRAGGYAAQVRREFASIFPEAIDRQEAADARGEGEPAAGPDARPDTGE